MSGNLPDGTTQSDIDRAFGHCEDDYWDEVDTQYDFCPHGRTARCQECIEEGKAAEWDDDPIYDDDYWEALI